MSEKSPAILIGCGQVATKAQIDQLSKAVMLVLESNCNGKTKREALSVLKNGLKADGHVEACSFSDLRVTQESSDE